MLDLPFSWFLYREKQAGLNRFSFLHYADCLSKMLQDFLLTWMMTVIKTKHLGKPKKPQTLRGCLACLSLLSQD